MKKTIFLIEDDEDDRLILKHFLSKTKLWNENLVEFSSSIQTQGNPDIILLDMSLRDTEGLDSIYQTQQKFPGIPIILVTGSEDQYFLEQSICMGVQDYLQKDQINPYYLEKTIITALNRAQLIHSMAYKSSHDDLTGVLSRAAIMEEIEKQLYISHRHGRKFFVVFYDVNDFKEVNDEYGHQVGDLVLKTISLRMKNTLRKSDFVGRIGGDEFLIVISDVGPHFDYVEFLEVKAHEWGSSIELDDGNQLKVGLSYGHALYPEDGSTSKTLIEVADERMYKMKELK